MLEIIETLGGAMVAFIESLIQTITTGFSSILWSGTGETRTLSDIAVFLIVLFAIGMTVGAAKLIFNLIKNR